MLWLLLICVFLSIGLVVWMMFPDPSRRIVRKRIYTEVKGKRPVTPLARLANLLAPINKPLASGWYFANASRKIEAAGLRTSPLQTLVVQEMGAALGVTVYFLTLNPGEFNIVWMIFYAAIGAMAPSFWLTNKIRVREYTQHSVHFYFTIVVTHVPRSGPLQLSHPDSDQPADIVAVGSQVGNIVSKDRHGSGGEFCANLHKGLEQIVVVHVCLVHIGRIAKAAGVIVNRRSVF